MLSNLKWQRAALLMNLFGALLLFYSFQATSSDIRLVTAPDPHNPTQKQYAVCAEKRALIVSYLNGVAMGVNVCPDWENAKPAAVVNIEHPFFEGLGFLLLAGGFVVQFFAVPHPETIVHLREQIKLAKLKQKSKESN